MKLYLVHSMTVLCVLLAIPMLFTSCGKQEKTSETAVISSSVQEQDAASASSVSSSESAASEEEGWKADFEKSLLENYGVTPESYEDLGDGVYQVYVKIDGKLVPYVAVDSKTGDYHG